MNAKELAVTDIFDSIDLGFLDDIDFILKDSPIQYYKVDDYGTYPRLLVRYQGRSFKIEGCRYTKSWNATYRLMDLDGQINYSRDYRFVGDGHYSTFCSLVVDIIKMRPHVPGC